MVATSCGCSTRTRSRQTRTRSSATRSSPRACATTCSTIAAAFRNHPRMRLSRSAVACFAIVVLAAQDGGFGADSWGWAAVPLLLVVVVAVVAADGIAVTKPQGAMLLLFAALAGWTALSAAWAPAGPSILESERVVVYLAALAAVVAVGASASEIAAGVLAGSAVVSAWALWGRLFPDHAPFATGPDAERLAGPLGYANRLGPLPPTSVLDALVLA